MYKKIEDQFEIYNSTETWYCESLDDLTKIPEETPAGSIAQILTNDGLVIKMKNSSGNWIDI